MKVLYIDRNHHSFDCLKVLASSLGLEEVQMIGVFCVFSAEKIESFEDFDLIFVNGMLNIGVDPRMKDLLDLIKKTFPEDKIVAMSAVGFVRDELVEMGCKYPEPSEDKLKGVTDIIKKEMSKLSEKQPAP
jgi:hypothetical protein